MTFREWAEKEFVDGLSDYELKLYEDTWRAAQEAIDVQGMVGAFRKRMGLASRLVPDRKAPAMRDEYEHLDFLLEELAEFSRALRHRSFPGAVDALADLIYYAYGTAHRWGVDLQPIIALVHAANMLKEPHVLVAGKLVKPPGWQDPDIGAELIKQGWKVAP